MLVALQKEELHRETYPAQVQRPIETGVAGGGKTPGHSAVSVTPGTEKVAGDKPGKAPEPSKPAAERPIAPGTEPGRPVVKPKDPVGAAGIVQV